MKSLPLEISLDELLEAREQRQQHREELLKQYGKTVVCLMVNQPGAQKVTDASVLVFRAGQRQMQRLEAICLYKEERLLPTGWEGFWVFDEVALALKRQVIGWEEQHPLGRLWDIDVYDPVLGPLSRAELQLPPRQCLLCSAPGAECARSRRHTLFELDQEIQRRIENWQQGKDDDHAGVESLGNGKRC